MIWRLTTTEVPPADTRAWSIGEHGDDRVLTLTAIEAEGQDREWLLQVEGDVLLSDDDLGELREALAEALERPSGPA